MSHWNYRVIKRQFEDDEVSFDVCEVYYNAEGKPTSWISDKNVLSQDSMEDLQETMKRVEEAMRKPILEMVVCDQTQEQKLVEQP